jgi:hypothetical protein
VELVDALEQDAASWIPPILDELRSLKKLNTFKVIRGRIPADRTFATTRWVLRQKFKADGLPGRRKARLVARGYEQQAGIDYRMHNPVE